MPYLDVRLNDAELAVGGAASLDLLSLTIVGTNNSALVSLQLGGMQKRPDGETDYLCWSNRKLRGGDRLRITALQHAQPNVSVKTGSFPTIHSVQEFTRNADSGDLAHMKDGSVRDIFKPSFEIRFSDSTIVRAAGNEETLQLVATWFKRSDSCRIEVDSVTALDDGQTRGQRWVERLLRPQEWLDLEVRIEQRRPR